MQCLLLSKVVAPDPKGQLFKQSLTNRPWLKTISGPPNLFISGLF